MVGGHQQHTQLEFTSDLLQSPAMCVVRPYLLAIAASGILMVAIMGAAVSAVQHSIPVLLFVALWWISTRMYRWLFPGEPAVQVPQAQMVPARLNTAPEIQNRLLMSPMAALRLLRQAFRNLPHGVRMAFLCGIIFGIFTRQVQTSQGNINYLKTVAS